jgi:hypothetical protein
VCEEPGGIPRSDYGELRALHKSSRRTWLGWASAWRAVSVVSPNSFQCGISNVSGGAHDASGVKHLGSSGRGNRLQVQLQALREPLGLHRITRTEFEN